MEPNVAAETVGEVVSAADLRRVMATFATGVTVVSTLWEGVAHAMTATAFASVSLEPPLVLVCVGRTSRFHGAVLGAGRWAVSVLNEDQEALARHFAHRGRDLRTQFDAVEWRPAPLSGAPLIAGALSWLECQTAAAHEAGDHTVVVGRVLATSPDSVAAVPLTYYRGTYRRRF